MFDNDERAMVLPFLISPPVALYIFPASRMDSLRVVVWFGYGTVSNSTAEKSTFSLQSWIPTSTWIPGAVSGDECEYLLLELCG